MLHPTSESRPQTVPSTRMTSHSYRDATATLACMAESIHSYWDTIEPVWDKINIYEGEATFLTSIQPLPRPVVLLYAAHFCLSEIYNGGHLQFFWNNTGILCPEAIE